MFKIKSYLRAQEWISQLEIVRIAKLPQHSPGCLQTALLDEEMVQIQEALDVEAFFRHSMGHARANHVFDSLQLLRF